MPKIITDNKSGFEGGGTLTDFTTVRISDGIRLEGVEEEFTDKNLYYDLINKAKARNGTLNKKEYNLYNSILNKYGITSRYELISLINNSGMSTGPKGELK
ncbi:MAG: hypothetical protein PVG39_27160 [Desulfobacteraceae bacterium]